MKKILLMLMLLISVASYAEEINVDAIACKAKNVNDERAFYMQSFVECESVRGKQDDLCLTFKSAAYELMKQCTSIAGSFHVLQKSIAGRQSNIQTAQVLVGSEKYWVITGVNK